LFTNIVIDVRDARLPTENGPGAPPAVTERRTHRAQVEALRTLENRVIVARKLSDQRDMWVQARGLWMRGEGTTGGGGVGSPMAVSQS
jgi:hypothetical protein